MVSLEDLEYRLDRNSDELRACPTLRDISGLSDGDFHHLLIQRRFVSLAFTPFYDLLIDALDDPKVQIVCRQILREEYPAEGGYGDGGNDRSHREDLVVDLIALGIAKPDLMAARPTRSTADNIAQSLELVLAASAEKHRQVAMIATAACYAEALVNAEYRAFEPRIEQVLPFATTTFYGPHAFHDCGHVKRLLEEIRETLDKHPEQLHSFDAAIKGCLRVKLNFYQQFENRVG